MRSHSLAVSKRKGIAQLEFISVLVVLLPLFSALLWIGIAGNAAATVTINARHLAWRERQATKADPFDFVKKEQGKILKASEQPIRFTRMFNGWWVPRSNHMLFAGSWDHRELVLDRSVNRKTMIKIVSRVAPDKVENIQSMFGEVTKISSLKDSVVTNSRADDLLESELPKLFAWISESSPAMQELQSKKGQAEADTKAKAKEDRARLVREIDADTIRIKELTDKDLVAAEKKLKDAKTEKDRIEATTAVARLKERIKATQLDLARKKQSLLILNQAP